ncbi:MAG TPA: GNAT family N-acetyltransferase [Terriglobia bacterium]|nr:GNAT family N-acetyltransferase [Terriglobia bacterium]
MQYIRPATPADVSAITAIYRHHVLTGTASFEEEPPSEADMANRLAAILERHLPYLCLETADPATGRRRIAGYAYAGPYRPRSAYRFTVEDSIYVAPDATGRGHGRALLERLIADCRALKLREIIAVIGDSANSASIGLHRQAGFRDVGTLRQVGFKFGRWLDSVLMQLSLQDTDTQPDE